MVYSLLVGHSILGEARFCISAKMVSVMVRIEVSQENVIQADVKNRRS